MSLAASFAGLFAAYINALEHAVSVSREGTEGRNLLDDVNELQRLYAILVETLRDFIPQNQQPSDAAFVLMEECKAQLNTLNSILNQVKIPDKPTILSSIKASIAMIKTRRRRERALYTLRDSVLQLHMLVSRQALPPLPPRPLPHNFYIIAYRIINILLAVPPSSATLIF